MRKIDITVTRKGKQLVDEQCLSLTTRVTETEIFEALNSINDLTAPGIDGYGARFFKITWSIIKKDIIAAVMNFFDNYILYGAANNT